MQFSPDIETNISLYQAATGHDRDTAIARLMEIGFESWWTDDYYKPERVCGRVRPVRAN